MKEKMKCLMGWLNRLYHVKALKYIVVTVIAVAWIGFLDENSVWNHLSNSLKIGQLADEIEMYNERYRHDQEQIHLLDSDPKAMEKIARERYFMKTDDEDIYVLSDDPSTSQILQAHESVE
jgi:cell division protein FtsB